MTTITVTMKVALAFGLAGLAAAVPQSFGTGESSTTAVVDGMTGYTDSTVAYSDSTTAYTDSTTPSEPWTTPQIPSISITDSSWDTATSGYGWDTTTTSDYGWDTATTSDYGWSTTPATTTKTPCGGGSSPSTTDEWGTYSTPATSIPYEETSTSDYYSYSEPVSSTAWNSVIDSSSIPYINTSTPVWPTDTTPSVITVTAPCTCCTDAMTSAVDTWSGYPTTPVTESLWSTYSNFTMTTHVPIPTTSAPIATFTGAAMPTAMPGVLGAGVALIAAALIL